MEPHGIIPWYLVNDPDRGMIKNDSTTAIDRGFLYIGINNEDYDTLPNLNNNGKITVRLSLPQADFNLPSMISTGF